MSMREILDITEAAFKDPDTGIAARVNAIGLGLRADVNFKPWKLDGQMNDARQPDMAIVPDQWDAEIGEADTGHRDALARLRVIYECFSSNLTELQDNVVATALAVVQVVAHLREYSDANGGTIIEVDSKVIVRYGDFAGGTSGGFTATFTLAERSTQ